MLYSSDESNSLINFDRKKFVAKTYLCLDFQLLITFIGCFIVKYFDNSIDFLVSDIGQGLFGLSLIGVLLSFFSICCFLNKTSQVPWNYLLLLIFSLSISYLISYLIVIYSSQTLLIATSITFADTFAMSLIALTCKFNADSFIEYLLIGTLTLFLCILVNLFIHSTFLQILLSGFGAGLYSCFIIYDTKQIISKENIIYKKNDYVIASINLYLDILNLFNFILNFFGLIEN
jgi:FtsH-binding integral membrane protein